MDHDSQAIIYIENWNDLCRLCLRNDQPLQNLFFEENILENIQEVTNLTVSNNYVNVVLFEYLTFFVVLQFSIDDSLPNSVCKLCIDQVNSFVEFRVRCKTTDEWLRNEAVPDTKVSFLSSTFFVCNYLFVKQ